MKIVAFILIGYLSICVLICTSFGVLLLTGKIKQWQREYNSEDERVPLGEEAVPSLLRDRAE